MESFFKVKKSQEVLKILDLFGPSGEEKISLEQAQGRVLAQDLIAPENLPGFFRSTMDGYAVQAKGTFGASESIPALFDVTGEVLMGQVPQMVVGESQAVKISTGGMLPEGADGVVMLEYCHVLDEDTLEINRAISPLENVIQPADDFGQGDHVFKKGRLLGAQDLGLMAGFGQSEVIVYKRPKVAVISTGDEIVPIEKTPSPGQVRDINRYTLGAFCRRLGATPLYFGLCPDDFEKLRDKVAEALSQADSVWLSGGSSVGTRDLTLRVFETMPDFTLLVHGISISPGKPTIIAKSGSKPVIGLPGHVTSALVVAEIFLTRLLYRLSGRLGFPIARQNLIEAELSRNIESSSGRDDYIRVKLTEKGDKLIAEPIFGKSGLLSTLVEADGLIRVDMNTEGLYQGDKIKVLLFESADGGIP